MGHRMLAIAFSPTDPRCHGNEISDKMGYNLVWVRDFCEIFTPLRGFSGWAIECCTLHFSSTGPRCHGNEIWDKIGHNSPRVRNICEFLRLYEGFRGWAIECCQLHFSPPDPRCHGNEIWDKIGYNSLCVEISARFLRLKGVLWMGHRMLPIELFSSTLTRSQCDAGNITFCNFCCFRCASS